jgi:hypothetical protein
MSWKIKILLNILALLLAGCVGVSSQASGPMPVNGTETQSQSTAHSNACPVTLPPNPAFIPPEPYQPEPLFKGVFWYGSPALWTLLPTDGIWRELPYSEETGYTQKVLFWRDGYDPAIEPQPALTLSGVRLDSSGETFTTNETTHAMGADIGSAMLVGIDIPTTGCWQLGASYKGEDLSFILQVQP